MSQFFYDQQIRRFVGQFVRFFSEFDVEYGKDKDGNRILYRVPCRYADTNRTVSSILRQNSENSLNNVPMIVVYIDGMQYDRGRMQEPHHVDKKNIRTLAYNQETGQTTTNQATAFTIERLMPAPYKLTVKIELWTSNFDQKLQLYEQILPQFNPDMEIQSTDNYLDWTSLSYILLTDVVWTTRNIPVGSDDPIDIGTMTFELPIWLTVPSKLKKLGVIKQVVDSVYDAHGNLEQALVEQSMLAGNRQYFTPMGHGVILIGGRVTLAPKNGPVADASGLGIPISEGNPTKWAEIIGLFGEIVPGISMLYLIDAQTDRLVTGTIAYDPNDPYSILFNVDTDTIPTNSLPPSDSIIDPRTTGPGAGLPPATLGQRYLILNDIGHVDNTPDTAPLAWLSSNGRGLIAHANDIIEYTVSGWQVKFDSTQLNKVCYMTNLKTQIQYKWTGVQWVKSYEGLYQEGYWSIVI
jgi:hypothetical protein